MPLDIPLPSASAHEDISQYVPLLFSAIEGFLQSRDVWADGDYIDAYLYMEDLKLWIVENIPPVTAQYPTSALHLHGNSKVINGNPIEPTVNTAQMLNGSWRQNTSAYQDEFEFEVSLAGGTYDMELFGLKSAGAGIVDITIDGDYIFQTDFYRSSSLVNYSLVESVVIVGDGVHTINCKINGKNASSSGYSLNLTYIAFRQ